MCLVSEEGTHKWGSSPEKTSRRWRGRQECLPLNYRLRYVFDDCIFFNHSITGPSHWHDFLSLFFIPICVGSLSHTPSRRHFHWPFCEFAVSSHVCGGFRDPGGITLWNTPEWYLSGNTVMSWPLHPFMYFSQEFRESRLPIPAPCASRSPHLFVTGFLHSQVRPQSLSSI